LPDRKTRAKLVFYRFAARDLRLPGLHQQNARLKRIASYVGPYKLKTDVLARRARATND